MHHLKPVLELEYLPSCYFIREGNVVHLTAEVASYFVVFTYKTYGELIKYDALLYRLSNYPPVYKIVQISPTNYKTVKMLLKHEHINNNNNLII